MSELGAFTSVLESYLSDAHLPGRWPLSEKWLCQTAMELSVTMQQPFDNFAAQPSVDAGGRIVRLGDGPERMLASPQASRDFDEDEFEDDEFEDDDFEDDEFEDDEFEDDEFEDDDFEEDDLEEDEDPEEDEEFSDRKNVILITTPEWWIGTPQLSEVAEE